MPGAASACPSGLPAYAFRGDAIVVGVHFGLRRRASEMQPIGDFLVKVAGYGLGIFLGVGLCRLVGWL